MNIALLHYSAPPVVGGVESVMGQHARLMATAGHQVRIIAGRGDRLNADIPFVHLPLAGSRHAEILALKAELDAGRVPSNFQTKVELLAAELSRVLKDGDILIAHNVCSLHKNLALTAALKKLSERPKSPRLILWHHDLAWTTPRYRNELHAGYPWDLLSNDWPNALQVVVSELRRQELCQLLGISSDRVWVVPNGVDLNTFLKLETQTIQLIHQLELLDSEPLFLLPVRLTPRKNIELALHTLAALRDPFPAATLIVTGPMGPHNPANLQYFERLLALRSDLGLQESAHFLAELAEGFLPDAIIADFYRLADALFLPSREEGFGIPVLEAGLAGIPVFCADIPPLQAIGAGWATYFSPDDPPEKIAAQITSHLAASQTFHLRIKVRRRYSWDRIYAKHIAPLLAPEL